MERTFSKTATYFLFALLLFGPSTIYGAEDVVVRLSAEPDTPWLGQKVVLTLDVLGKDGWAQLKKVYDHEFEGGYLKRYETQGTRLQETIGGAGYTGQRYEYLFFPQRAGELVVTPMDIDVEVKRWGAQADNEIVRATTPQFELNVRRPPQIQLSGPLISTSDFSAAQKWQPESTDLSAGDAVIRIIELTGADLSGMVFPPIENDALPGIGVYPATPEVDDRYSRGDLTGKRVEKITYVMEQPGDYQVGELEFSWWNVETERLETISLSGKTFVVEATPAGDDASAPVADVRVEHRRTYRFSTAAAIVLLVGLGFFVKKPAIRWYRKWKAKKEHSENNYFKNVTRAAAHHDQLTLLNAAMQWLDLISEDGLPARLDLFLLGYGDSDAVKMQTAFCSQIGSTDGGALNRKFYGVLVKARSKWLRGRRKQRKAEQILPEIGIG